jgi:hypothetical protein
VLVLLLSSSLAGSCAQAQNWRGENPNQPNGYRASEFDSHYHGDLHLPAQQQNGYRASEARSHYGGSRFEPASGWSYSNNNSNTGRSWQNASNNQTSSGYRSGERAESSRTYLGTARCLQRLGELRQMETGGSANQPHGSAGGTGSASGAAVSRFGAMLGARREQRENAVQNMIRSGSGGFNHLYVGN